MILGALWLKRQGFGRVDHHRPISKEDLEKNSVLLQSILSRSKSLKQVVWFHLMFHLVHLIHRGRKTFLPLTKPCRLMQLVRSTYITTSFPGFSPSRPRSVGRVGDNPGNEVAYIKHLMNWTKITGESINQMILQVKAVCMKDRRVHTVQ